MAGKDRRATVKLTIEDQEMIDNALITTFGEDADSLLELQWRPKIKLLCIELEKAKKEGETTEEKN